MKHCINNVVKPIWKKKRFSFTYWKFKKKEISAIANVIKQTEFQSVRATWKAIIRRPYIKLKKQRLLSCDSAETAIRFTNWQRVQQWAECLNEINVLRGISNRLCLSALPLTNQYTCRERPDAKPVQTQTVQVKTGSVSYPKVCFFLSVLYIIHTIINDFSQWHQI